MVIFRSVSTGRLWQALLGFRVSEQVKLTFALAYRQALKTSMMKKNFIKGYRIPFQTQAGSRMETFTRFQTTTETQQGLNFTPPHLFYSEVVKKSSTSHEVEAI